MHNPRDMICENCLYFQEIESPQQGPGEINPSGGGGNPLPTLIKDGECHFLSPLPNGKNFVEFPKVELSDWCGNFVRDKVVDH